MSSNSPDSPQQSDPLMRLGQQLQEKADMADREGYDESFHISLEIARKVLPFLGDHRIAATPENYIIFYLYFEGSNEVVRQVVDTYLESGTPWTEQTTKEIYRALFSSQANLEFIRRNEEAARRVRELTQGIIEETSQTAEVADRTSQTLTRSMAEMDKLVNDTTFTTWLKNTLQQVREVSQVSSELSHSLRRKEGELEELVDSIKQVEMLALTDDLTRLANRRAWEKRLEAEFTRYKRYRHPCSVALGDLDDFKQINDRYGHLVGDQALKEVAQILDNSLRTVDFVARYGGEEFTLLMPDTNLGEARLVCDRLRQRIDETRFTVRGQDIKITMSFGIACFHESDPGPNAALERADQAMYLAKIRGKNRVCGEDELTDESCHWEKSPPEKS